MLTCMSYSQWILCSSDYKQLNCIPLVSSSAYQGFHFLCSPESLEFMCVNSGYTWIVAFMNSIHDLSN